MKSFRRFVGLILMIFVSMQCAVQKQTTAEVRAEIVQEGFIDCYEKGLLTDKGKPFWCETSAVLFYEGKLYLGNDHQMPDHRSAVFTMNLDENTLEVSQIPEYSAHPLLKLGSKYEDFSFSPDRKTTFLITGFDRVMDDGSAEWDGFNGLYYWPSGKIEEVRVISKTGSDSTSVAFREEFGRVLADESFPESMPYFKTEGLSVLDDQILFGIREYGKNYSEFSYAAKIISVSYERREERIFLKDDFEIFAELNPQELVPNLTEEVALSSIEYDPKNEVFYLLTSFEDDQNGIGAYLWTATLKELKQNQMRLVKTKSGDPLKFDHKAEDMTFLSEGRLLVIHDDDKVVTEINGIKRQPHQAAFSVVRLE